MAKVPGVRGVVQNIRATRLTPPSRLAPARSLKRPVAIAEPRPVVRQHQGDGEGVRVGLDLHEAGGPGVGGKGGRKIGWRPVVVDYGASGFPTTPTPITPRGWAPNRYPPGHLNAHLLDVFRRLVPPDAASGEHVTNAVPPPSTMFGTVMAIRRGLIVQRPGLYDATPAGFRASGKDTRANPPPAGLFGMVPTVLRVWRSYRNVYGVPFAFGNRVWHREDPPGSKTSTSSLKAQYRSRPPHRYELTQRRSPGVNPALVVGGGITQ